MGEVKGLLRSRARGLGWSCCKGFLDRLAEVARSLGLEFLGGCEISCMYTLFDLLGYTAVVAVFAAAAFAMVQPFSAGGEKDRI